MGITNKYEIDTTNYGTTGWNAILATGMEKLDDFLHTYLRYKVASGESIGEYNPVRLRDSQWQKATSDGIRQPAHGIAIESGVSGEYLRAQTVGPLTNILWAFSGSGEVYVGVSGEITQTRPSSNAEVIGSIVSPNTILIQTLGGSTSSINSPSSSYQSKVFASGETVLKVRDSMIETIALTAPSSIGVIDIISGEQGMIKVFAFDDSNFTFKYNPSKIILQGLTDANFSSGDLLVMLNRGGNQSAVPKQNGYWKEIWRSLYA